MNLRFVVLDRGLDSEIYKIPAVQSARLANELFDQKYQVFESLADAKNAAMVIVSRYGDTAPKSAGKFSAQTDPRIARLHSKVSGLTEDRVQLFFI